MANTPDALSLNACHEDILSTNLGLFGGGFAMLMPLDAMGVGNKKRLAAF